MIDLRVFRLITSVEIGVATAASLSFEPSVNDGDHHNLLRGSTLKLFFPFLYHGVGQRVPRNSHRRRTICHVVAMPPEVEHRVMLDKIFVEVCFDFDCAEVVDVRFEV